MLENTNPSELTIDSDLSSRPDVSMTSNTVSPGAIKELMASDSSFVVSDLSGDSIHQNNRRVTVDSMDMQWILNNEDEVRTIRKIMSLLH